SEVAGGGYIRGCVDLNVLPARIWAARVHEVVADDIYLARPILATHVGFAINDYIALDCCARGAVVDKNAIVGVAAVGGKVSDMPLVVVDIDSTAAGDVNSVARVCAVVASARADVRVFNGDVGGVNDIHAVTLGGADPEPGIDDVALAINYESCG